MRVPRQARAASSPAPALLVRFWGVRGSVAVPGPDTVRYGGNTACVEVRYGREIVILDAGTGIRDLGKRLAREFAERAGRVSILITHTHWDHIQGFPFFAPAYLERQRIRIRGWRGSGASLRQTVASAVESPFFPVALPEMPGTISVEEIERRDFRLGSIRVRCAEINHPGYGVAYRLETPAGSLAYVPDHEVTDTPVPPATNGAQRSPGERTPSRAISPAAERRDAEMRALIQGVDLLIHDAQYTAAEYARRVGWGHSCVDATVRVAAEAGVGRLVLFHHDPDRTDAQMDTILAEAQAQAKVLAPRLVVEAAREGAEHRLTAPRRASRSRA